MLDRPSVPRRALDFEDYVSIVRRNFRWLLGPLFAGLVISTVVAYLWKDTYVSQALIRIVPQQISPEVVPEITSQDIADRINGMAQTIESHNTLSTIITSFGLYPKEMKSEPLEDVIAAMKSDIHISPVEGVTNVSGKSLPAMRVAFSYSNPIVAQKVTADIVSRFMNANTQEALDNQQQADLFINAQYDQAKKDLDTIETKLADFRTKNAGRLPEEVSTNLAQMNALEQRGASVSDALARNAETRMMLESDLNMAKDRLSAARANSPQTQAQSQKVNELDREIDQLDGTIADMKNRYTDDYPNLQTARDRLKLLKQERDDAFKDKPKAPDTNSPEVFAVSRERQEAESAVNEIQLRIKANDMEAKRMHQQGTEVNGAISSYQGRLEGLPAGQKEYADLMRDRDLVKQRYDRLEMERQRSAAAIELNRRKQGETLEVLDSASLPTSPSQPKRYIIVPVGAIMGLVLGFVIVGMREVKDTSLKSLKDARLYTQLSVLGSVPLLENDVVVQRRKQAIWIGWAAATVVGLAIMAGSVLHYYLKA
ncbi:MAG: hypothetical protein M3Y72_18975 [Acidobacteriota bacterium]|nr:hypothetical protein [Acidobacteriota bacterium]